MKAIYDIQAEQGWNDTTLLQLLLEYLENQQADDALLDFIHEKADSLRDAPEPKKTSTEKPTFYRLHSAPMIHTPEIVFAMQTNWENGDQRQRMHALLCLMGMFPTLTCGAAVDLLSGHCESEARPDGTLEVKWSGKFQTTPQELMGLLKINEATD